MVEGFIMNVAAGVVAYFVCSAAVAIWHRLRLR